MQLRLLGSLEVSAGGQPVDLGAARQQVILAMLLLEAGRVVPTTRLIDAIWDDEPPATARSQVQICISALRRMLSDVASADPGGHGAQIVTRPPGYALLAPAEAGDIWQFETLVARGRAAAARQDPDAAVADLRAALALWRGPAAAGIESRIVRMAATRLDETRLAVLGDCLGLELELGRHHEVIGELREIVAAFPLHERLRGLLMLALYRAGRSAEALESYRAARDLFQDELGLDPGEELRSLEQAILVSDGSLDPPAPTAAAPGAAAASQPIPRQLPARLADFTGREDLLARIGPVLVPPGGGLPAHVPVVTLTGKGGIGKTSLALHVAHLASDEFPDGQLYAQLHGVSTEPRLPAAVLEGFLRAFGVPPSALPDRADERTAMYRSWLADRRVLVVLDDAASLSQVLPLLPGSPGCAVIITTRYWLGGPDGAQQLEISAFDEQAGMALLANVIGTERVQADEPAALQLVRLCDRMPLALRIIAAKLAARPHWQVGQMVRRLEDGGRRLDELDLGGASVRATIAFSYEGLADPEKQLLARLSLLGSADFPAWVSGPLLALDAAAAADLLEELVAARLVEARVAGGTTRYQLHDLVRLFAAEQFMRNEPATARTATLGRLLGCWLFLAGEAHRRECGGDFSLVHGSAPLWPLTPAQTDELLADPLGWLSAERAALVAAIHQAARAGFDELCWDLATTTVTLFEAGTYVDDWRATHEDALDAVLATGNRRGEAMVQWSLATLSLTKDLDDAARRLDVALARFAELGDIHGRALALGQLAFVDRLRGRDHAALDRYQDALAGFQAAGDLIGEADMLRGMAKIHLDQDADAAAEDLLRQASLITGQVRSRRVHAQTLYQLGELRLKQSDLSGAQESFDAVLHSTRTAEDQVGEAYGLLGTGTLAARRGDHARARDILQAALELAAGTGHMLIQAQVQLRLADVAMLRADRAEAAARLEAACEILRDLGPEPVLQKQVAALQAQLEPGGRPASAP